jgi:hypothetical protein
MKIKILDTYTFSISILKGSSLKNWEDLAGKMMYPV